MEDSNLLFKENIVALRSHLGLNKTQFANYLNENSSIDTFATADISNYELYGRIPNHKKLEGIFEAFCTFFDSSDSIYKKRINLTKAI